MELKVLRRLVAVWKAGTGSTAWPENDPHLRQISSSRALVRCDTIILLIRGYRILNRGKENGPCWETHGLSGLRQRNVLSLPKEFYRDVLGLRLTEDGPFAIVFDANGTMLRIQKGPGACSGEEHDLGWRVDDIRAGSMNWSRREFSSNAMSAFPRTTVASGALRMAQKWLGLRPGRKHPFSNAVAQPISPRFRTASV